MAWNKILSCFFSRVVFHQEQTRIRNGSEEPTTLEQTWSSDTLHSKKHSHVLLKMFLTEKRKGKKQKVFVGWLVSLITQPEALAPVVSCVSLAIICGSSHTGGRNPESRYPSPSVGQPFVQKLRC
uniref:Uncharacterized protein n=1 Tax=Micrurus carvalhoi TaxID=3147026 RepID=A0A2H6NH06_9SAUR